MSSNLIEEVKQEIETNSAIATHHEQAQTQKQPQEIDYSPTTSKDEQENLLRRTNFGILFLEALAKEIIKPIAEIQIQNIFKIDEAGPVKINQITVWLLCQSINVKNVLTPDYKHIIPHLYKLVLILPSLVLVEVNHLEAPSEDPAVEIPTSISEKSTAASMPRSRSTSSNSKKMRELKSIFPYAQDIPKSFFNKKLQQMEHYLNAAMKKIDPFTILVYIHESLSGLSNTSFGFKNNIKSSTPETKIADIFKQQFVDPVISIFEVVLIQNKKHIKAERERHFSTFYTIPSSDNSSEALDVSEHLFPDLVITSAFESGKDTIEHILEFKRPSLFIYPRSGKLVEFERDIKLGAVLKQLIYYCYSLNIDSFSVTDGFGFLFSILDEGTYDKSQSIGEQKPQPKTSEDYVHQNILRYITFNGLDTETYKPLFQENDLQTRMLIALVLYLKIFSGELAGQDSDELKQKMQSIFDKAKKQRFEVTLATLPEEQSNSATPAPATQNSNAGKKVAVDPNTNQESAPLSPASYNSQQYATTMTSAPTTADIDEKKFIARIPFNFNEFKVIQDRQSCMTKVIKITRKGLQQYFIKPGSFLEPRGHDDTDYNVVLKLYSFNHLENYFWNFFDNYMKKTFDEFVEDTIEQYETEVGINKIIKDFNDTVDDPSKMINSPRMLAFGRMTSARVLTPFDGYFIAFDEVKTGNNKFNGKHMEGLIDEVQKLHMVNIAHGDLATRNILVDEYNKVHLIDYNCAFKIPENDQSRRRYGLDLDNEKLAQIESKIKSNII
ncbi:hypothetical protein WICANDRAFT_75965 [Wickerhamomyces anomalus NRRL Y-366-8]|uniref:Uncharacterized protein n=1 Tax=Wickerhamomyces anomalus (strain ATCC 58044 / CBS 1984 / NCYC 433 / NRRL Y-366-8) TaxID=683960 RepID=A0A1E3PA58_WICAA|nr:uncharacterized protein WICANDRAFT_75965 [Wickerhamomyces anomalus NRRL Y-366-8]ODQ61767.1 hypothetical protein WICANDRAFT_75965 [Wickerhamomyces anomalus NRRL Y-366-8]